MPDSSLNEVFRFFIARPPKHIDSSAIAEVSSDTELAEELLQAMDSGDADQLIEQSESYLGSETSIEDVQSLPQGDPILQVLSFLDEHTDASPAEIVESIETSFGSPIDALSEDASLNQSAELLGETLAAIKFSPEIRAKSQELAKAFRVLRAIQGLGSNSTIEDLPAFIRNAPITFGPPIAADVANISRRRESGTGEMPDRPAEPAVPNAEDIDGAIRELLSAQRHGRFVTDVPPLADPASQQDLPAQSDGLIQRIGEFLGFTRRSIDYTSPTTTSDSVAAGITPLSLNDDGVSGLSEPTIQLLDSNNIDYELIPITSVIGLLEELPDTVVPPFGPPIELPEGILGEDGDSVPISKGRVRPSGVADLLIVRQQIKEYRLGEVGHIENVLTGEKKNRTHRRLDRTEDFFSSETSVETTDEREYETTERFELQNETSKTISSDSSIKAGVSVSGSYGPSVEFSSSFEGTSEHSDEQVRRTSSTYAKDIVDRSLRRVVEQVREQQTKKIINEIEETNFHELNNTSGAAHISGVYQWVDKVYEAQVFNYGKRLLFDFIVPEPAALMLHATTGFSAAEGSLPQPPEEFTLTPNTLYTHNYRYWAGLYGAQGVEPPPPPTVTTGKSFKIPMQPDDRNVKASESGEIEIPPGYAAVSVNVSTHSWFWERAAITVVVGDKVFSFLSGSGSEPLASLEGKLAVTVVSGRARIWTVAIQVFCIRSTTLLEDWKFKTFDAIRTAYNVALAEYEDKMAAIDSVQTFGGTIQGRNPKENRQIEKTELKRASIELITEQRFDLFNAMRSGSPTEYPSIDFDEAELEGEYIRFFELAFEWDQMTYIFYPYFWGKKEGWIDRILQNEVDPVYKEFLKSGAARVVVPVRPGFDSAVLHYLETGQLWNGLDEPPEVSSPLFVSLVEEVKSRTGNFEEETAVGEPWDVVVPTSLVKLRVDDQLPSWEKLADGTWRIVA